MGMGLRESFVHYAQLYYSCYSDQVSFGYTPEKKVFHKMSISADLESRIALVWNAGTIIGIGIQRFSMKCRFYYWYVTQMFGIKCKLVLLM